ncbi:MAG: hypothetical protein JWL90_4357 [Chthoniobacteraceae bacterium]|nr:hypothetical protein [Chthoniobacteraceae bacterium]
METSHRPIVVVDPGGPIFADLFKAERRMLRIMPPQAKLLPRLSLNLFRKLRELFAKCPGRRRFHPAALPPQPRFPSTHFARLHPARQPSRRLRTRDLKGSPGALQSSETTCGTPLVEATRWLLRFRSTNSQPLISFNGAAIARTVARPKRNGAAAAGPRNWQRCCRARSRLNTSMRPQYGLRK